MNIKAIKEEQMPMFQPIGSIHSPYTEREGMPIQPRGSQAVAGTVELFPEFAEGLKDLDGFSHVILLYHFHRSEGYSLTVTPFMDTEKRGLFSTRAPKRPNPIGLSIVRLVAVQNTTLHILGVDVLDGTPLLDIKPYAPAFDQPSGEIRSGWLEKKEGEVTGKRADGRFV
jgi:tRNA-Thr(GGU) m(6)t(6)A37 methyltransferase TsaA